MLGGLFVILVTGAIAFLMINHLKGKYPFIDASLLKGLFFYHVALASTYYAYVMFNPSDSKAYYFWVASGRWGDSWFDYYGTSTIFIQFLGYPFVHYLAFTYEAMMALFAFFGFLGFVYFYILFKENIRFKHTFMGYNLLTLIFFLPNLHFWSSSFGKGSIIFLGVGLFFYGLSKIPSRVIPLVIGALIIYHVRPHVMLLVLVSSAIGFTLSTKGISVGWRVFFLTCAVAAFFFIYQDVLSLIGVDEEELMAEGLDLSHRTTELKKASSGVDLASYSLPMKLFTFLYRPLFLDAPGPLGLVVSFENLFYLICTFILFRSLNGFKYLLGANFLVKSAALSFLTLSVGLSQISANLGLALRQKSQVMMLLLFVIISYLDEKKFHRFKLFKMREARMKRIQRDMAEATDGLSK